MVNTLFDSLTKGKTYTIPADQLNADAVHPVLTAAPFMVRSIDDESGTFQIVGTELKFKMTSLENISVWGETKEPLKFEEGRTYEFIEDLVLYFHTRYNQGCSVTNGRNEMVARSLIDYLGGVNVPFTVKKVGKSGDVVTIEGKEDDMPPHDLMYVLEADDRRYFRDITESADKDQTPPPTLEDKIKALLAVPGYGYVIRSHTGATTQINSADGFMKWLDDELSSTHEKMIATKKHHAEMLAQATELCETIRKVV